MFLVKAHPLLDVACNWRNYRNCLCLERCPDHRHDAGADRLGELVPAIDDQG